MPKNRAILFVLAVIMFDAIGIGLMFPVMPDLLQEVGEVSLGRAAVWGSVMSMTFAAMQFLFGPLVGALSDRYGRRPVLLVSIGVMALDYVIMGFAHTIWLLILTRVFGGITAANQSAGAAVIADLSEPAQKAANFGLLGAAFGIGFILGPAIGGFVAELGPRAPFFVAAAAIGTLTVVGYFTFPETLAPENRRDFDWRRANPFGGFKAVTRLAGQARMLVVFWLNEVAFVVYPVIWSFFVIGKFGWEPWLIGLSLAGFGISMAFTQGYLIRILVPRIGESRTLVLGLLMQTVCYAAFALAPTTGLIFALLPLSALGLLSSPAMQGILSRAAPDNAQGELQGVVTSVRAVAAVVGPLSMGWLFETFTAEGSVMFFGAPFVAASCLVAVALLVFLSWRRQAALRPA
ncbi:MAG: MFS transporter [Pseudomonadota bacterium]